MKVYILANPYFASSFKVNMNQPDSRVINLQSANGFEFSLSGIEVHSGNQYYLIGNGNFNNQSRTNLFAELLKIGVKLNSLFSDSAFIDENTKIGIGTLIHSGVSIDCHVSIGFNTIISQNTILSSDVSIGSNCFIGPNVTIEPGVKVGNNSYIRGNCRIEKNISIERDVVINDSYIDVKNSVKTGMILDKDIGEFVRIIR